MPRSYEEIKIGERASFQRTITEDMVKTFADLSGDYNPVHLDDDFCRRHGLETKIAHGALLISFLSALIGMYLPGEGALWMSHHMDFILPAKIGDTIRMTGEVVEKTEAGGLGLKTMKLKIEIRNQLGRLIAKGSAKVALKEAKEEGKDLA